MTNSRIVITNATLVNEGAIKVADLFIKNGRIEQIGANLSHLSADQVIDASGLHVMPGMIDDQVHFREPGLMHKGDIHTESRAAVAGGITSYMEMPNTKPPTTNRVAIEAKLALAKEKSAANYAFYLGATNDNIEDIASIDPHLVCGVKVFMGASTGNMLVDNPQTLENIFAKSPVIVVTHCEDTPTILANEQKFRAQFGEVADASLHPLIRSDEACFKSSSLAVSLAKRHGTKLHVLHLTTAKEMALFDAGPITNKQITAEVCVHHLFFNAEDYAKLGNRIKCNPSIKFKQDQEALINAVIEGKIDIIATDHAPHTLEEKNQAYWQAPAGLPLVQHALLCLLEHYHDKRFSLELIVNKTSHAVAERFAVKDRGYLREGYWADLVLIDLNKSFTVLNQNILYKCGWSPFDGFTFRSRIHGTMVNGNILYQNGKLTTVKPEAMALTFNR